MKNALFTILVLLISFSSRGQCTLPPISGASSVSIGLSTTFYNSYPGGTWTTSNASIATINATTGVITGISTGSATIRYYAPSPCISFIIRTIQVNTGFTRTRLCLGDTITMQNFTTSSSVWSSSNTSVVSINSGTGFATALSTGHTIITHNFIIAGTAYVSSDSIDVAAVSSVSGFTTGPLTLCAGQSTTINNPASVIWLSTNPTAAHISTSTPNNITVHGDSSGTTKIKFTSEYCPSLKDSVTIVVHPTPTVGYIQEGSVGPGVAYTSTLIPLCYSSPTTLIVTGLSDTTGYWTTSAPSVATIHGNPVTGGGYVNGTITGLSISSAYDTLTYTSVNSFGCSASTYVNFTVSAPVIAPDSIVGPSYAVVGTPTTYILSGGSGTPGYWSASPLTIATISYSGTIIGIAAGTAIITYYSYSPCGTIMTYKTVHFIPAPIVATCPGFSAFINSSCGATQLGALVSPHTTSYSLKTIYGDGNSDTIVLAANTSIGTTIFNHVYSTSGTYIIKQILYSSGTALDSVSYSHHHLLCRDLHLSFYADNNNNCIYDSATEYLNFFPLQVVVDSNGVHIDTISITGGIYYQTHGHAGDVYSFRLLGADTSWHFSCPASGIIYDTIMATGTGSKIIGIHYPGILSFDLIQYSNLLARPNVASGSILVYNLLPLPQNAVITMNISPKYSFNSSYPSPTSVIGNTVTWDFTMIYPGSVPPYIIYYLSNTTGIPLPLGDTVHNTFTVSPIVADVNPLNNSTLRIDTVRASCDPNHISVSPEGNILNGTKLHYAIEFENDGNDTAQNIYVMDTLSDALNVSTFRIVGATHAMNISMLHSGGHNIVKFEFPNIKLLDSTHHGHCTGTVFYTIKAKTGLANGTQIVAHAGIYFDDNPVVLTDTTINTILLPNISIATTSGAICSGDAVHFSTTAASVNTPHYHWYRNSITAGTDSAGLTLATANVGDTVRCVQTTIMDDTVYSTSNSIILTGLPLPVAGNISGPSAVCVGADISLSETVSTGSWSVNNINAAIAGGIVNGVSAGTSIISYSVSNGCGTAIDTMLVTVNPLPDAGTIVSSTVVCITGNIILNSTTTGGVWSSTSTFVNVSGGILTGVSAGTAIVSYTVNNSCGTAIDTMTIEVFPMPVVSLITGNDEVCTGATIVLNNSSAGGIWSSNNTVVAAISGGTVTGVSAGIATITYMLTNACGAAVTSRAIHVLSNEDCNTGIATEAASLNEYKVYPNPNTGNFVFTGKINTLTNEAVHYDIIDITGKVVYNNAAQPQNGIIHEQINLSNSIVAGQYMVRVVKGDGVVMVRFVVVK